jgi:hypothetical protein
MAMLPPMLQRLTMARDGLSQLGSVVQFGPSIPTQPRTSLTSPRCPLRSRRNIAAAATAGVITGR